MTMMTTMTTAVKTTIEDDDDDNDNNNSHATSHVREHIFAKRVQDVILNNCVTDLNSHPSQPPPPTTITTTPRAYIKRQPRQRDPAC